MLLVWWLLLAKMAVSSKIISQWPLLSFGWTCERLGLTKVVQKIDFFFSYRWPRTGMGWLWSPSNLFLFFSLFHNTFSSVSCFRSSKKNFRIVRGSSRYWKFQMKTGFSRSWVFGGAIWHIFLNYSNVRGVIHVTPYEYPQRSIPFRIDNRKKNPQCSFSLCKASCLREVSLTLLFLKIWFFNIIDASPCCRYNPR